MQYVTQVRMHRAREQLRAGRVTIAELAGRFGYESAPRSPAPSNDTPASRRALSVVSDARAEGPADGAVQRVRRAGGIRAACSTNLISQASPASINATPGATMWTRNRRSGNGASTATTPWCGPCVATN